MSDPKSDSELQGLFSSKRERRLWLWTISLVVAIYSTLAFASTLVNELENRNRGFMVVAFLTCMFMVATTVLTQGLKTRPKGLEIGVAVGIAVVYFMVFLRTAMPERSHLIEYGVVAVFVYEALLERFEQGRRVPVPWLQAIALTTLIGTIDEAIQYVLPNRFFELEDILFNFLAALMAVVSMAALRWARRTTITMLDKR